MDFNYFQKINNNYKSQSKQETDLYLLNRYVDKCFADTIDFHKVYRNGQPFELLIIKDTDGNTFKKKIKSKHSNPFNLGDYIGWNNQKWIITLIDSDEKAYHSGYMYLCTFPLRWQNSEGKIIERWAYVEDFTKYSSGVKNNNTLQVGDNQYGITIPIDKETKSLKKDIRLPVDFDDTDEPDVYVLTNKKTQLNNNMYFGRGGVMTLTLSIDFFNPEKDKHVALDDGTQAWICDYHSPATPEIPLTPNETTDLLVKISGNTNLKNGCPRTYTVSFTDDDYNEVSDVEFTWKVISNFDIEQIIDGNTIKLCVDGKGLIGSSFLLQVITNDNVASEIKIEIIEAF